MSLEFPATEAVLGSPLGNNRHISEKEFQSKYWIGDNMMKTSIDVTKILSQLIANGSIKPSAIDQFLDRLDQSQKSITAKVGEQTQEKGIL